MLIGLAVSAQLTAENPYTLQWAALFPLKIIILIAHSYVGSGPRQKRGCLGPPESTSKMTSQLVQPFLQGLQL